MGAEDHLTLEWTGVLAGPIAWASMLGLNYALTKWSCSHGTAYVLQIIVVLALALTAAGAYASWDALNRSAEASRSMPEGARSMPEASRSVPAGARGFSRADPADRARFMGLLGLASAALFAVLLIASSVPIWTLHGVCF